MDGKGNIIVKVKGKAEDIADLKLSSMRPTLDMSGKEGIYRMQSVEFDLPEGITLIGEYLADIEISLIPASTPIFVPTPTAASEPTPTQEPATEIPSESPPATDESTETSPAATPENGGDVESGSLS